MKKRVKLIVCTLAVLGTLLCATPTMAGQSNNEMETYASSTIQPRTAIKEWVFKVENGNLYKRLYNYTTGHWETDWIFVMSGVTEY